MELSRYVDTSNWTNNPTYILFAFLRHLRLLLQEMLETGHGMGSMPSSNTDTILISI